MNERTALQRALFEDAARWRAAGLERIALPSPLPGVDFTSNDTLGLARHPEVVAAAHDAIRRDGAGGRAARLLGGGGQAHEGAESAVADWLGADRALLFPTGYQANLGVIEALAGPGDVVVSDELNHASLIDAARLSRARVLVYRHGDVEEAERHLRAASAARRRLLITESIFSMDGDLAPLGALADACVRCGAGLVIDEAHALGVLGPQGAGGWSALSPSEDRDSALVARVVTGSKALGVAGGFVVGEEAIVEHVRQRARAFVFTTAPPPAVSGALGVAISVARRSDAARARLRRHAHRVASELDLPEPDAAVLPYRVGDSSAATELAARLQDAGLQVRAVRPPTVPPGTSRLRIVVHAFNTEDEIEQLVGELRRSDAPRPVRDRTPRESRATPLFVAGTDTGIGKTVVSALLLRAAAQRGPAAYFKPVQTGEDDDTAEVARLAETRAGQTSPPHCRFALPASPHEAAAAEGSQIDLVELEASVLRRTTELGRGTLIVELAGGLMVPLNDTHTQLDWMARRRAACVLVARSGLGTLNHSLLSIEALRARHLEPRALFLFGPSHPSNHATLSRRTGLPIFEVPVLDPLGPAALKAWLDGQDLSPVFA